MDFSHILETQLVGGAGKLGPQDGNVGNICMVIVVILIIMQYGIPPLISM